MALACFAMPGTGVAQQQLGPAELVRARSLLELYRTELSAAQYSLLSGKLIETRQAYAELLALTEAGGEASVVAGATAAGGEAMLGSVVEVLPLLIFFWPATAHAPGMKEEKPAVRAARTKLETRVKDLEQAVQQVEAEVKAAPPKPKEAPRDKKPCYCICGDPKGPNSKRKSIGHLFEFQCASSCVWDHHFPEGQYTCL
ncbi:MAG TPA: hypothetical protein VFA20_28505 [Myxococcaceae bacterium]|nr:hypothetical protein [Myxococcaceae bacterium]